MPTPRRIHATYRAIALSIGLALAVVACDNKPATTPPVPHAKSMVRPKVLPTVTPLDQGSSLSTSPEPASSSGASASPTPLVAVSAPPITFPYTKAGVAWTYGLTVKLSLGKATGSVSIGVKAVTPTGASLVSSFTLTDLTPPLVQLPNMGKATSFTGDVKSDVSNPYALGVLFPKAGAKVVDTVTGVAKESLTVAAGPFDTTKYTINEQADSGNSTLTLWTEADGTMVKEEIKGNKPPPLIDLSALGSMASLVSGPTTTTLELQKVGTATFDQNASGAASPDPNASGGASVDPHASGSASADPHASGSASADPNASGGASPSPSPSTSAAPSATPT